ncbi:MULTISPECIES: hypothetical protein [Frankia]|uniref:ABC transporter permease n=1 Tax=Frankia alni (strain DSM 45986 / CECT 9034 / ACN14a) TaxID=326424 RepID=Q0RJC2_FRAAA|nr:MULTISPECIES: hypothetical protein [Frankia]CAJ62390.1 Putative ABC transporter permease [Frankia alni ACN14a]
MTTGRTMLTIARFHLLQRFLYLVLPWAILAFSFAVNLVVSAELPADANHSGGLATIYIYVFAGGLLATFRSLPFGLALGVSRRSYYLGTAGLGIALAAVFALALTAAQAVERATGGWGVTLHFFDLAYLLTGPWYQTWLTSFVGLVLMFVYGMWWGLVYRRWNLPGLVAFLAGHLVGLLAAALAVTWTHTWAGVGDFFTALSAVGLTGVLAVLAAALLAGGFTTIRRVTV